jgi:hypothetical protein
VTAPVLTVRLRDARALGYCARGCRTWCERHGFEWSEFRGPGLPLEAVAATGDAMAVRLVQQVRSIEEPQHG